MSYVSILLYLSQVTDNQCVIKALDVGRNIAHSFRQTRSQVSLTFTIMMIHEVMNNVFHIIIVILTITVVKG